MPWSCCRWDSFTDVDVLPWCGIDGTLEAEIHGV
jgi:hypothetical protein